MVTSRLAPHLLGLSLLGIALPCSLTACTELFPMLESERAGYKRRCEADDATGCWRLGLRCERGDDGEAEDLACARRAYARACELGDADGCGALSSMHYGGRGGPVDWVEARRLAEKGCSTASVEGSRYTCALLGFLVRKGRGGPADPKRARLLLTSTCKVNPSWGCVDLAWMWETGQAGPFSYDKARELYARACDAGDPTGCASVGGMYLRGVGVAADPERAGRLFEQARALDRDEGGFARQRTAMREQCEGGDAESCSGALMWSVGLGGPEDDIEARALLTRGCDGDHAFCCFELACHWRNGEGGKQDAKRAAELLAKACSLGYPAACTIGSLPGAPRRLLEPSEIRSLIDNLGPAEAAKRLRGDRFTWAVLEKGIASGHREWLALAAALHPGAGAGAADSLHIALGAALARKPEAVLRLLGPQLDIGAICSALPGEGPEAESLEAARSLIDGRIRAVRSVRTRRLAVVKQACLVELEATRRQQPARFGQP